jgi:hypothetical protein
MAAAKFSRAWARVMNVIGLTSFEKQIPRFARMTIKKLFRRIP